MVKACKNSAEFVKADGKLFEGFTEEEEPTDDEIQFNFKAKSTDEILELLKATDVNTLTPIEAMQTLYDLKKKAEEIMG